MHNWQKHRNYRKYKNADGTSTYTITVNGEVVEVSKAIYTEYASASRKIEYMEHDLKRDRIQKDANGKAVLDENSLPIMLPEREVSLDRLIDGDWDFPSSLPLPEEVCIAYEGSEIDELRRCIAALDRDERSLINALFFCGLTEREYAKTLGISKTTLHVRKIKVLTKIKKYFSNL